MHKLIEPIVVEVGQLSDKDPGGLSGYVLIAESHISIHTFPLRGFVSADVYTCQNSLDARADPPLLRGRVRAAGRRDQPDPARYAVPAGQHLRRLTPPDPRAVASMDRQRQQKAELLQRTIKHIDITAHDTRALIDAFQEMSFSARELGRACEIYERMLRDPDCTIILTVAGSTSAAGCMQVYVDLVRHNMVDAIVATGATMVDMDFFEALGFAHYRGSQFVDDGMLREHYIDRIYDTFIDEDELQHCDRTIKEIADGLEPRPYSSREFIREMGRWLVANPGRAPKRDSLVQTAYEHGVPIFCPAFSDSSAGFGLVAHQVERPDAPPDDRFGARLPRADRAQDRRGRQRPLDDRRRLAQELRPGHRGLRRDPGQDRADAQVQRADHGRRRPRRRLLELEPQGGELLGQGRRRGRADGVRRGDAGAAAARRLRLSQRQLEAAPAGASWRGCWTRG